MKVFKWEDYYDTERCPHCGRLRLMIARTEYGTKRVCEKCGWCVEDNNYFVEDETIEEER
nr:MAG TPA: alpha-aminoadipate carrier protein [Bacteriophage sp.]